MGIRWSEAKTPGGVLLDFLGVVFNVSKIFVVDLMACKFNFCNSAVACRRFTPRLRSEVVV
jgi:hypothetical protein